MDHFPCVLLLLWLIFQYAFLSNAMKILSYTFKEEHWLGKHMQLCRPNCRLLPWKCALFGFGVCRLLQHLPQEWTSTRGSCHSLRYVTCEHWRWNLSYCSYGLWFRTVVNHEVASACRSWVTQYLRCSVLCESWLKDYSYCSSDMSCIKRKGILWTWLLSS